MRQMRGVLLPGVILSVLALAALPTAQAGVAAAVTVIHSFGDGDGEYPATDLVMDSAGALYGTTTQGGDLNSGTVFRLVPTGSEWSETVLYSFTSGADGSQPYNGVTLDPHGNLYGTTVTGGTGMACEGGCGVVYKLTRGPGDTWTQRVLYNFKGGDDGSGPGAGLTFDRRGNLYGMTPTGGAYGLGVIYRLSPNGAGGWTQSVIHAFTGGDDGSSGSAGRLLLHAGSLYGVATVGGTYGKGTAFKLTPAAAGSWTFQTLYAFKGPPDGGLPYGAVVRDSQGRLYGTTYYDGANGFGVVYRLTPTDSGPWDGEVLYSFQGGSDGGFPISHVNLDADGHLYGTASEGGAQGCNCGTVFRLTHDGPGQWHYDVVQAFTGSNGKYPYNGLVAAPGGKLYGATVHGGDDDDGVVFEVSP